MSRKRETQRALAEQQAQMRRRSSAHRSLRQRANKRQAAADAGVADAGVADAGVADAGVADAGVADADAAAVADDASTDAGTPAEANTGGESATDPDTPTDADTPTDPDTPADATADVEADTDTVVFARVPEFLRDSQEIEVDDDAAAPDAGGEVADTEPADTEPADTEPAESESDPEQSAQAPDDAATEEPVAATASAAVFDVPEDTEPAYEPDYVPAADQQETMVMEPVAEDAEPHTPSDETILTATAAPQTDAAKPTKRRRWPWIVLVVLLVLAAGYYGLATYFGTRVPSNTEALGVDISGQTVTQATDALNVAAATTEGEPITLTAEGATTKVVPSEAGLSIDTAAMVDDTTGFTLNPITVFSRLIGGTDLDPVVLSDADALDAAMKTASVQLDSTATDATVTISGTTASAVPGTPSVTVDQDDTAKHIVAQWPAQTQIEAVAKVAGADVPDHEADRTVTTLNETVLASAVTLTGPNGDAVLEPDQFAPFLRTTPADGRLDIIADGKGLAAALREIDPELENDATDATLSFDKDHKLKTTDGEPGRALDDSGMGSALVEATMAVDHTGPFAYREVHPKVSNDDLGIADLKEVVSSFSTPLTAEPIRTKNLVRGAEKVTGVVVLPRADFDLTDALTPISREEGYYPAHVIVDGILTNGIGGGLSQMATTTYNAGYFAGYEDIDHRPHSKYFARYPAGRESTIYTGQINMVFRNNTPYAAVMSSYVKNNRLYVDIWSTPYFTVKTEASPKTNFVQPKTVTLDRDDCEPSGGGGAGFKISNTRTVFLEGNEVDKTTNTWTYLPDNKIECK